MVGKHVFLQNLKPTSWNGKTGICQRFDRTSGRYLVTLDHGGDEQYAFFPRSLVILPSSDLLPPTAREGLSLTRSGLQALMLELRALAAQKGHKRELLTALDAAAIFTDGAFRAEPKRFYGRRSGLRFHPMDRYPACYSPRPPDVALTFSWSAMCLQHHLPRFLDQLDAILGGGVEDRTYWIDVLLLDPVRRPVPAAARRLAARALFSRGGPLAFILGIQG